MLRRANGVSAHVFASALVFMLKVDGKQVKGDEGECRRKLRMNGTSLKPRYSLAFEADVR